MSEPGGSRTVSGLQIVSTGPREIAELIKACKDYVLRATGMELDLCPETLPILDHYVTLARPSVRERPELEPLLARAVGAYFGEVVRRQLDGFWSTPTTHLEDWHVCARQAYFAVNPTGAAYDAFAESMDHGGPSGALVIAAEDRDGVARRLNNLPEARDSDYFLLSTRLEVIEIAVEALRSDMIAGGNADVSFSESDYLADLAPN